MTPFKKLAIAGAIAAFGLAANASTLIFNYSGTVNDLQIPDQYSDLYDIWNSNPNFKNYYGTAVVENFDQYASGTHTISIAAADSPIKLSLVNGMFLSLAEIRHESDLAFSATITTEDGVAISGRHRFYKGHYDDHVRYDRERLTRDYREMRGLIESSWGYAITCHKAQGSQWENVVVYDDGLSRTAEDRNRWLYTAITRAERGLVILD